MNDGIGQTLHEGNLVQVMLGQQPVRGYIVKLKEGGVVLSMGKNSPQGMTPDVVFIQAEIPLLDAQPGQNHPAIIRLPDPGKEIIVPVTTKEVA